MLLSTPSTSTKKSFSGQGFTLVELLVALALLSFIVGVMVSQVNFKNRLAQNTASKLLSDFTSIEVAFTTYGYDHDEYPEDTDSDNDLLDESSWIPSYLFPPRAPTNFTDYVLTPSNSTYYICTGATVSGESDYKYRAMVTVRSRCPSGKVFINTACGATSDTSLTSGTLYLTYWILR